MYGFIVVPDNWGIDVCIKVERIVYMRENNPKETTTIITSPFELPARNFFAACPTASCLRRANVMIQISPYTPPTKRTPIKKTASKGVGLSEKLNPNTAPKPSKG